MKLVHALCAGLAWIAAALAPAAAQENDNAFVGEGPALFVVRDTDSTLYLFGTIHISRPGDRWAGPNAQSALARSPEIWTEFVMTPQTLQTGERLAMQLGRAAEGQGLSTILSDVEYRRLSALAARFNLSMSALDGFRPWLVATTISLIGPTQAGYDVNEGVDRQIDAYGDANGKTMRGLETIEDQLQGIARLTPDAQRAWLTSAMREAEQGVGPVNRLANAWRDGDLATIQELIVDTMREEAPAMYGELILRRHAAWMPLLTSELDGAGVDFVAVGVAHLPGPDGLIALLRARGYSVERVAP